LADESICVGPAASERSYLNIANVVSAAQIVHADAIHPGYGFLSENAYLAKLRRGRHHLVGPKPRSIQACATKSAHAI